MMKMFEPSDATEYLPTFFVIILVIVILSTGCAGDTTQGSNEPSEPGGNGSQTEQTESEVPSPEATRLPESTSASAGPVGVETSVIATRLEVPWGVVFTPDGEALVSERDSGRLLSLDSSGNIEELQRLPESGTGEGGLLGIALSPNYGRDGLIYAYYSTEQDNRVVRFRQGEEPEPILTGIPVNIYHDGGRIAFGPDGNLYIGTGDAGNRPSAQDINSLGGKILRITPEGEVPQDNPFPGNPVYSYGHRNVQGLAWDAGGQLYATEFGQDRFDEVNRIVPGGNYGWPEVEGEGGLFASEEYIDPISTWSTDEASPSGAAILVNGAIPQWEGNFFMAGLRGQRLWRLALDPDGTVTEREELLKGEAGRLRDVVQAPNGSLWILTSNRDGRGNPIPDDDRILRLGPANR
jgi:glucose/arabinose dehydrogenase